MTGVLWEESTSTSINEVAAGTTLVLPIGATEQHGPHLPVGVDAMIAEHVARAAARVAGARGPSILVAPVLPFGSSHHHLPRAGTLSLSGATMLNVLTDVLSSAAQGGIRKVFVLNGHGGNDDLARQAVREVALRHPVTAAAVSYWSVAWDELVEVAAAHDVTPVPGHAGAFETSLVLALRDDLVDRSLVRPHVDAYDPASNYRSRRTAVERHGWVDECDGYTDGASSATADIGRALFDVIIAGTAELLADFAAEGPADAGGSS